MPIPRRSHPGTSISTTLRSPTRPTAPRCERCCASSTSAPWTAALERIQTATLLIWGADDRWVPLGAGRRFATELQRTAFVIVPHAGHAVQEEAPAETTRLLIRFLTQGLPRVPENLASGATGR